MSQPKMLYIVIATLRTAENNLWGYRLLNINTLRVVDVSSVDAIKGMDNILEVAYDSYYMGLVSTGNVQLSSLPVLDSQTKRLKGLGGLLLYQIVTDSMGKDIGAVLIDTNGAVGRVTLQSLRGLLSREEKKKALPINFSIDSSDLSGNEKIKVIEYGFKVPRRGIDTYKKTSYKVTDSASKMKNVGVLYKESDKIPVMPVYSLGKATDSSFNINTNDMLFKSSHNLKILSPYYYVLLSTITKQACTYKECKTVGVTETKLYYNVAFISSLTIGELVFILIHETLHIAMMHAAREGKRNHKLWNIATDLYINELIVHDFELIPGVEKEIEVVVDSRSVKVPITAPVSGYYFSKIGEVCNLSTDTPELIYKRLYDENKDKKQSGKGGNEGQNSENESQDGSNSGNPFNEDTEEIESGDAVTYNGKELDGESFDDIMSNVGNDTPDKQELSEEQAKQKVQDMATKKKMVEEKLGSSLTKGMTCAELVQRIIEFNLKSSTDWRRVLKNILKEKPKKKYTLASPNEAYMNMGITLASRKRIGRPEVLKGIVICIDVSGSIGDDELSKFLGEVSGIFDTYNADGLLMYWNTSVCDFGKVSNKNDLTKVNSNWSGGTDVKCVFSFLSGNGKTVKDEKVCPLKGKDIKAVIILTDGYFDRNYSEYEKNFGRKTLWVIDGNPALFNPCFGEVVPYRKEEE